MGHSNMESKIYVWKNLIKTFTNLNQMKKQQIIFEIYFGNDADKRKVILAGKRRI